MPTLSAKHLACSTPSSTVPSIVVDDTPNTTIDDDSRETTPEAEDDDDDDTEELPAVIKDAHHGKSMKILMGFGIYVGTENKKKTRTYLPINSQARTSRSTSSNHFTKTGPVILQSKTVFWWGSIPNVTEWNKSAKNQVHNSSDYAVWLNAACNTKKKLIGLNIKMPHPGDAKKRAEKEDLLAKQEVRAAASKKRKASSGGNGGGGEDGEGDSNDDSNGDGSESKIDADKFDDINFHMRKIHAVHPVNVLYDRIHPIYQDPANPQRYILLTLAAMQTWAADMMARKDGVDEHAPHGSSGTVIERNKGVEEAVHPPNNPTLPAYLDFLGLPDRDTILEVLASNGFTNHQSFCSLGLPSSKVRALGLNLGTVTALFDHTEAFDNHLSAQPF
ncbi:hypothetical protein MJO28_006935 [Puccinia striiformis f. sp. tritici]|uniref:Uncharacterized protein n=1 Tax=Puccinia striiformis f. sp. tritici TaxID=168172 RepID=A0ACC0ECY8_9BASI|nr:hypothetical protein MJO28_006935 [Puccinia striiformis f. sp. tritici]